MTHHTYLRRSAALIVVLALLISFALTGRLNASTEEPVSAIAYVYEQMAEWADRMLVDEVHVNEVSVLQVDLAVDSIEEPGIELGAFDEQMSALITSGRLPHDRIHLDLITIKGERLESFDIDTSDMTVEKSVFPRFEGYSMDGIRDPEQIGNSQELIGEQYDMEGVGIILTKYGVFRDDNGTYAKIWFTFANMSEGDKSADSALDMQAFQGDEALPRHGELPDAENTTLRVISHFQFLENCTVAFYLKNEEDNVDFTFAPTGSEETNTVSLPIADMFVS